LKKAGVADDNDRLILTALDDEKVFNVLNEDLLAPRLRQDIIGRNMDLLKADRRSGRDFDQNLLQWKAENEQGLLRSLRLVQMENVDPTMSIRNVRQQTVLTTEALTALDRSTMNA